MNRSRPFDVLLIDFYGTIAAGDSAAIGAAATKVVNELNIPLPSVEFSIRWGELFFATVLESNGDSFQNLSECVRSSLQESVREYVGEINPADYLGDLEDYWSNPPIHDDVAELIAGIDLPVCCVSNADTEPLMDALKNIDLKLDAVVDSESVRCYKPEPGIFEHALDVMQVEPSRALHVGDSLHSDIGGAAPLGITTVWLQRGERCHDIGSPVKPDFTISRLTELIPMLSS